MDRERYTSFHGTNEDLGDRMRVPAVPNSRLEDKIDEKTGRRIVVARYPGDSEAVRYANYLNEISAEEEKAKLEKLSGNAKKEEIKKPVDGREAFINREYKGDGPSKIASQKGLFKIDSNTGKPLKCHSLEKNNQTPLKWRPNDGGLGFENPNDPEAFQNACFTRTSFK